MPRALAVRPLPPVSQSRDDRLRALRERRAAANEHGCNYWIFADEGDPDALLEFVEGPDRDSLLAAYRAEVGEAAPPRILLEVELG